MKVCLILLGLCACALGMNPWMEAEDAPKPKPCCTPAQWEGYMGEFAAYYSMRHHHPGLALVGAKLSYDSKAKKIAISLGMPRRPPVKVILDFSQQKRYFIYKNGTKCSVSKTKRAFKPWCIPKTAKFGGTFYQGAGGAKLNENSWAIRVKSFHVNIVTTKTGCVPVSESVFGHARGTLVASAIGYANITPGIKSASVFKPPKSCKQVDEEDHFFGEDYPILDYMSERFHEDVEEYN